MRKYFFVGAAVSLGMILAQVTAWAGPASSYSGVVTAVGCQSASNLCFFEVPAAINCNTSQPSSPGDVYIDVTTDVGRGFYATIMSAKLSGATIGVWGISMSSLNGSAPVCNLTAGGVQML